MSKKLLVVVTSLLFVAFAKAQSKYPEELQHLEKRADVIVVGKVNSKPELKQSPFETPDDGYAPFYFRLQVTRVLKGVKPALADKNSVRFTSLTVRGKEGRIGRIKSAPRPPVKVGESYTFFFKSGTIIGIRPNSAKYNKLK